MAMGTRKSRERQEPLWYGTELPAAPGHPFYNRLNEALEKAGFDSHCEESCEGFYHARLGRPSLAPGLYFRIMMIGFFEGLDSERGIGVASGRFTHAAAVSLPWIGREHARPCDDFADQAADRWRDPSTDLQLGAGATGAERTHQRQDHRGGFDHAGSECGNEVDCQARHGRE